MFNRWFIVVGSVRNKLAYILSRTFPKSHPAHSGRNARGAKFIPAFFFYI